jgi:flagellar biosynthesis repressor protein FlbT
MSLRIELRPGEEIIINGALLVAEKRRVNLRLLKGAQFLRGRDFMREEDANTPIKRIYYTVMQLCLNSEDPKLQPRLHDLIAEHMASHRRRDIHEMCESVKRDVAAGRYYQALKTCKRLDGKSDPSQQVSMNSEP